MDIPQIVSGVILISLYLLIPGYALCLAAFPRKGDLTSVSRFGLSAFFGTFTMLIQYFNNKNFSIPIDTANTFATMAVLTVGGLVVWQLRLKMSSGQKAPVPAAGSEAVAE
jgi:uncharacterized membrane protein